MKILKPLLLGLMLTGSFSSNATDPYLGFGIGQSYVDQDLLEKWIPATNYLAD